MNTKHYQLTCVIIIMASLFICIGCKKEKPHTGTQLTIGSVLPLTGPVASYGKNAKSGIDIALTEINLKSKNSTKINIIYEDDEGKAQTAVAAAQKLISTNKVPLIIGEAASGLSLALAPICNKSKVLLFSPISSAAELSEKGGKYFFRVCPSDAFQARILSEWLILDNMKNVSLIYVNNSWGYSLKREFSSHFKAHGGTIVSEEACNEGDRDFKSQISKMIKPEVQAIIGFTYGKEGGPFLKQVLELGIKLPIYGGDVWGSPELIEAAGEAAEGVYFTFPASPSGEMYESFAKKYREIYKKEPDIYAAYSYDLAYIIANAFESGARTGEQVSEYLATMEPYEGVTGITEFDENGDVVTKTFDRKVIKNRKYVVVK